MSIVHGAPLVRIPVDPLFEAKTPDRGIIFEAVERQARAALGVEEITLTETRVTCWVDDGPHSESECTNLEAISMRWYVYQGTQAISEVPGDSIVATPEDAAPPLEVPGKLAKVKDPVHPAKGEQP